MALAKPGEFLIRQQQENRLCVAGFLLSGIFVVGEW
jgi:hypothetical protein